MYVIYEYQPAQNAMVRVGQSADTDYKQAIIKAASRYRYSHHRFEIHFNGSTVVKTIDNQPEPEF